MKFPCGFYTLGVCIPESSGYSENNIYATPVVKRWSEHGYAALDSKQRKSFTLPIRYPTKVMSIHAFGMCRIVSAQVGHMLQQPIDGALFLEFDKAVNEGNIFTVVIEAFDFDADSEDRAKSSWDNWDKEEIDRELEVPPTHTND